MWNKIDEFEYSTEDSAAFIFRLPADVSMDTPWVLDIDNNPGLFYYETDKSAKRAYAEYLKTGQVVDDREE